MKKILVLILALALVLGMSTVAMAEETHTVALANINEKGVFGKLVKQGFEKACADRGWELVYVDNNSDGQTAVKNAELLTLRGDVEFVVDMNVDASVGQTIMDIFNSAEIPVLAVDISLPGAPFFGIDSAAMGTFNGEWAAEYVKENMDGAVDYVVCVTQISSGDEVNLRVRNSPVAMEAAGIEIGEVVELEGENDIAVIQRRMTDFLTAHPDAEKIIVFGINENAGTGAHAAAVTAGREWDVRIVTSNCGAPFTESLYNCEGNQSWVASCANFPELYGEQCCQLMEKYFAGEEIAAMNACDMVAITWENIAEWYPLDNLPWANF